MNVLGREIGPYLVADSAYFLAPWVQNVYPEGTQDPDEIAFNEELSSAKVPWSALLEFSKAVDVF
jgi:hypothetical protein